MPLSRMLCCLALLLSGCSSQDAPGAVSGPSTATRHEYAPCNGEPGACSQATRMGGAADGCLCTYYCKTDTDCPKPSTGTVAPHYEPFGDYSENGNTASCALSCSDAGTCPDGMFCYGGACWGRIAK